MSDGLYPVASVAALALGAVLALGGAAAAQSAPAAGVSVDWSALGRPTAPGPGLAVDWSALDALAPATTPGAPPAVALHPPPTPRVAIVAQPSPPAKPVVAAPKPVVPAAAAVPPQPPAAPRTESAAAPAAVPGKTAMVRFAEGQADVPADGQDVLKSVAAQLAANDRLRLQLVAYASGSSTDAVEARRLALARAVALRADLVEDGVQSVRMDVRALGTSGAGDGPADRVDLVIVGR